MLNVTAAMANAMTERTLEVRYKGKSISEVLEMTIEDALTFRTCSTDRAQTANPDGCGLGYVCLGQSATTLSGGEAQRVKLAKELSRRDTGSTLYILDEPTTGLHFHDIEQLLKVLQRLKEAGNTVVVIEHNLDVVKTADYVVDLGPEGGAGGGMIVATGTPEEVANTQARTPASSSRRSWPMPSRRWHEAISPQHFLARISGRLLHAAGGAVRQSQHLLCALHDLRHVCA